MSARRKLFSGRADYPLEMGGGGGRVPGAFLAKATISLGKITLNQRPGRALWRAAQRYFAAYHQEMHVERNC